MDLKTLATIFASVFIAELGDKTQLATMLFAADRQVNPWLVFLGASAALVTASALGVLGGAFLSQHVSARQLHYVAGVGFIAIGVWTLIKA